MPSAMTSGSELKTERRYGPAASTIMEEATVAARFCSVQIFPTLLQRERRPAP